jgi:hypothetical protein
LFSWYVTLSERYPARILLGFLVLAALAILPVMKLELHTDMAELLPDGHPSVEALRRIAGRQKSATNLVMIVESPDPQANRRFAQALRPELDKLIPEVFTETQWRPDTEIPDHASRWRWMYADLADLQRAEELLDRIVAHRKTPLLVDLEGDPEEELKQLRKRLDQKLPPRSESDHFVSQEEGVHSLGVMMWRRRDGLGSMGDHQTLKAVQDVVQRINPSSFHPALRVRYTGHIAIAIEEQQAIREDIAVATAICTTLILLSIYLYFGRIGMLAVIGAPAFLGVLLSLALARFTIHNLNINTAFLISIILGNGINTPIILLARYGEERRSGTAVAPALMAAMSSTLLGTVTAMLAASIAYGCLLLTDFRGFSQFGLVGGAGMLLVWSMAFLLVPPLVIVGERLRPGLLTPRRNLWRRPFALFGEIAARRPWAFGLLTVGLLAASVVPLVRYAKDPLEWNMNNLRSDETEAQKLWNRMEAMGMGNVGAGYIANNGVLLVDSPEQADVVAEAMRKKDRALGPRHVLKEVRTINSILPKDQGEKLQVLQRIRQKIDRHRDLMDEAEWKDIQPFRPPEYLRPLVVDDLPRQVREAFTEVDGTRGRLVGIDADPETYYDWNGHDLQRLAEALTVEALGKTWVAASASTVFGGMLETIHKDGAPVTLAALFGVSVLVIVAFGVRGAMPVLTSVAIGVIWMGGILGLIKLKLNFMNFVALPITLGVGADYAANIWARLRSEGTESIRDVIADTGSAVALCSATTIIGYSSLLLARNQALRSFGVVADLGEVTCLLAALIVLPVAARAITAVRARRQRA